MEEEIKVIKKINLKLVTLTKEREVVSLKWRYKIKSIKKEILNAQNMLVC